MTLTATVYAVGSVSPTPTGQVTFQDGTNVIGQVPVNASGVATLTTSGLAVGSHALMAVYASDTNFAASSGGTTQLVQTATATTVTFFAESFGLWPGGDFHLDDDFRCGRTHGYGDLHGGFDDLGIRT